VYRAEWSSSCKGDPLSFLVTACTKIPLNNAVAEVQNEFLGTQNALKITKEKSPHMPIKSSQRSHKELELSLFAYRSPAVPLVIPVGTPAKSKRNDKVRRNRVPIFLYAQAVCPKEKKPHTPLNGWTWRHCEISQHQIDRTRAF
jgi:hypothetical protein